MNSKFKAGDVIGMKPDYDSLYSWLVLNVDSHDYYLKSLHEGARYKPVFNNIKVSDSVCIKL